jgi:transcriptional regulator with XRE-family HTH domain
VKKRKPSPKAKELTEEEVIARFAKRLRELRKEAGHSAQLGFAYDNKFSVRRYGSWEKGADIKLTNINKICKALGITLKEFFGEGFE